MALVTGASREIGIGAAIARALASGGWDVAVTSWQAYDARMPWGADAAYRVTDDLQALGARSVAIEADLTDVDAAPAIFAQAESALGSVSALVLAHAESVDSSLLDTSVESFDRHFAVNVRASWLLIRELAQRFKGQTGGIVALTSDHTVGNLPYGASKGALDRMVIAAAHELGSRGIRANVINPGPTDTGWISSDLRRDVEARTPLGRIGTPEDCARLATFLLSPEGSWITGQLLHSNGGFQ